MEKNYNASEILKLAISMEQEGAEFYETYAKKAEIGMKEEFLRLAADERKHEATFKKMYDRIEETAKDGSTDYLFSEQVNDFFRSFAAGKGFSREQAKPRNLQEVFEIGIATEKITIQLYEGILSYANEETAPILERLIAEEKAHQKILERHLAQIG